MALPRGAHVGPYEILGAVGAGGMGEVYRARDPRLGREVAIKVLPAEYAQDAARLQAIRASADGHSVFLGRSGMPGRFARFDLKTGRQTTWRDVQPHDLAGVTMVQAFLISADGRSYAYTYVRALSDLYLIEGLP